MQPGRTRRSNRTCICFRHVPRKIEEYVLDGARKSPRPHINTVSEPFQGLLQVRTQIL